MAKPHDPSENLRMLGFFPNPYPDETLYSLIARFQATMNWGTFDLKESWGPLTHNPHVQKNIGWLKKNLPAKHPLRAEDIVSSRTLFPVFVFGQNNQTTAEVRRRMEESGKTAMFGIKMSMAQERLNSCPVCRRTQMEICGESYWMRIHQVLTVTACPTHECRLNSTPCPPRLSYRTIMPEVEGSAEPEPAAPWEVLHAKRCIGILQGSKLTQETWREILWEKLEEKGFAAKAGAGYVIREGPILKAKNINERILGEAGILHAYNTTELLRKGLGARPDFKRLLFLMCLVNASIEDLNTRASGRRTRFPCRNPLAGCVLKETITKPRARFGRTWYACPECGYEYTTTIEDREANSPDGKIKFRTLRPGHLWEQEFTKLWRKKNLLTSDIIRRTGLNETRVHLEGKRLGLPPRSKYKTHELAVEKIRDQKTKLYKRSMLTGIKAGLGRNELRTVFNSQVMWLWKYEPEWMENHVPAKRPVRGPNKDRKIARFTMAKKLNKFRTLMSKQKRAG